MKEAVAVPVMNREMSINERLEAYGRRLVEQRIIDRRLRQAQQKMGSVARIHIYASAEELKERLTAVWKRFEDTKVSWEDIEVELNKLNV